MFQAMPPASALIWRYGGAATKPRCDSSKSRRSSNGSALRSACYCSTV
jgi:hypothetical protein